MAAIDCRKTFNSNVATITRNYDSGAIDIGTAKSLYHRELGNLAKCSGSDNSISGIPNPFEITIINYQFIKQLVVRQDNIRTFLNIGSIVKGERLNNENVQIVLNGEKIEVDKSYIKETGLPVTVITSEKDLELNKGRSTLERVAVGFLILVSVLVFVKLLKII